MRAESVLAAGAELASVSSKAIAPIADEPPDETADAGTDPESKAIAPIADERPPDETADAGRADAGTVAVIVVIVLAGIAPLPTILMIAFCIVALCWLFAFVEVDNKKIFY
jgi:hypothetical protein